MGGNGLRRETNQRPRERAMRRPVSFETHEGRAVPTCLLLPSWPLCPTAASSAIGSTRPQDVFMGHFGGLAGISNPCPLSGTFFVTGQLARLLPPPSPGTPEDVN